MKSKPGAGTMIRFALSSVGCFLLVAAVNAQSLTAEQWELVRNAERLVKVEAVRSVVRQWTAADDMMIEIQYPGGEEGEIWVNEVKAWLVSLGVPSAKQVVVPGSGKDDLIRFRLVKGGDYFQ